MQCFNQSHGIIHSFSAPYTPQQNGISERKNRTLLEGTRACLEQNHLKSVLWGPVLHAVNHVQNRTIHSKLNKSPYRLPRTNYLRPIGAKFS